MHCFLFLHVFRLVWKKEKGLSFGKVLYFSNGKSIGTERCLCACLLPVTTVSVGISGVQVGNRWRNLSNALIKHSKNSCNLCVYYVFIKTWSYFLRYKYTYMEEMLGNVAGSRQVFERWMEWQPEEQAWHSYINFELRYKEVDRARTIYERYILFNILQHLPKFRPAFFISFLSILSPAVSLCSFLLWRVGSEPPCWEPAAGIKSTFSICLQIQLSECTSCHNSVYLNSTHASGFFAVVIFFQISPP